MTRLDFRTFRFDYIDRVRAPYADVYAAVSEFAFKEAHQRGWLRYKVDLVTSAEFEGDATCYTFEVSEIKS